jgi:hypothetical protein
MVSSRGIKARVARIRRARRKLKGNRPLARTARLALSLLRATVGDRNPLAAVVRDGLAHDDLFRISGACRAIAELFEQGGTASLRARLASWLQGEILDSARTQLDMADRGEGKESRMFVALAALLAGAAAEDTLWRICEAHGIADDPGKRSTKRLMRTLEQRRLDPPVILAADRAKLAVWSRMASDAERGWFGRLTLEGVTAMVADVETFVAAHPR